MKIVHLILFRLLYLTGTLLSWRHLMLFAGASLIAASQACKSTPKMCYEIAVPDTTKVTSDSIVKNEYDSLYKMIDCYEKPAPLDTSWKSPEE